MRSACRRRGFTLIELLVVMAVVSLLLSIAAPRYFRSVDLAREAALRQDLAVMRDAIDKHFADTGRYPASLEELVAQRYIRRVPADPLTESSETWVIEPPADRDLGSVYDVKSGAAGAARDGTAYASW
ncbi:type II secretion system protein [uncultured Piscinibacter sp.]|uniref:type II secretion system protein n=1 Tax=uncultured Piscinibacter sp. TaxID=1131835 RepID=UPI00262D684E|nr:prepilin-type N-terminal cleavage/methylation domain-containing protein [uncultured Piscinibacter sp.]